MHWPRNHRFSIRCHLSQEKEDISAILFAVLGVLVYEFIRELSTRQTILFRPELFLEPTPHWDYKPHERFCDGNTSFVLPFTQKVDKKIIH